MFLLCYFLLQACTGATDLFYVELYTHNASCVPNSVSTTSVSNSICMVHCSPISAPNTPSPSCLSSSASAVAGSSVSWVRASVSGAAGVYTASYYPQRVEVLDMNVALATGTLGALIALCCCLLFTDLLLDLYRIGRGDIFFIVTNFVSCCVAHHIAHRNSGRLVGSILRQLVVQRHSLSHQGGQLVLHELGLWRHHSVRCRLRHCRLDWPGLHMLLLLLPAAVLLSWLLIV